LDTELISGLSAVLGSLVGGSASIATAWFTQTAQSRREDTQAELRKRETLYAEFISECSKLAVDALDHSLDSPSVLIGAYSLINRMRLTSSDSVVAAAQHAMSTIVEQYFKPNVSMIELRSGPNAQVDPLRAFSEACRAEFGKLLRAS
jgi:hypothetical protein